MELHPRPTNFARLPITARLVERKTRNFVSAEIRIDLSLPEIEQAQISWDDAKATLLANADASSNMPEHMGWNWKLKRESASVEEQIMVAVGVDKRVEGLMMVNLRPVPGRMEVVSGEPPQPVLYVEYIETAPWNQSEYAGNDALYAGVGRALIEFAIELSLSLGCEGRLGLHSLSGAAAFYTALGFTNLGHDPEELLDYFELERIS